LKPDAWHDATQAEELQYKLFSIHNCGTEKRNPYWTGPTARTIELPAGNAAELSACVATEQLPEYHFRLVHFKSLPKLFSIFLEVLEASIAILSARSGPGHSAILAPC
jgi:hypothetical protein